MINFNKNIYNFFKNKKSDLYLYLISFFESIFFPIPTDVFLIPKALINKERAVKLAIYTTIFSVLGGIAGYMIGYFFYDEIGIQIIEKFNLIDEFNLFSKSINEYGYLFIFIAGFTPIPYKIAAITSGLVNISLVGFIFFSVISRGPRFIAEALLCKYLGKKAEKIIRDYSFLFTILLLILFILIIVYKEIL
ncbi:MAG: YqaA family protein [Alphaproteobacteria bacterium]